ncbi:MAG: response regulator, partial [Oceanospirillaceae bacterium]|nr:response regulator [Oceanospirillaceae bacterium]
TPIIHGVIRIGWLAGGLQVLSALLLDQQTLTKLSGPLVAVVSVCMLVVLGRAIYVRHMLAPWLTIGWGLATLGLVSTVLTIHNTIHEPLYFLAVQFGFVVEGITFSAALAVRLRQKDVEMASANTRAREQQKRLLEAQKHELELQALVDELQMAKDKQAHMFSIIDAQNNRLNQALDFAGMWLFEENLSNGTGEVIRSQNTHEDEEFLVGPARLAATDEEYRSKIVDKLSRIGESVDFPLNFGQDSRKWVRNMTIAEYTDAAGNTIRLQLSQDITEFREQQNSLELANKELKDRSEKQAQIFSIIGHELRTPLASIKMMEDAMGLRNIGEYGANICDSTDAVLNIVDDLRTVINPEKVHQAQAVVDSPFDVLSRTIGSLEGLYLQHNVDVKVTSNQLSHSLCKFNAQALRQKITNLTKNAAIHADADRVWVDLQAQPRADEKIDLTLIVEDNGKGIPEGLREAVFGAFSRGDTRADGTGLGLYITRELAEKLGGTVEYFESEKGGAGFKVEFTLDLHLDANEQEQVEAAIPVALQGKRILLVEDQNTLQLLTSKLLKDAGAEVVVCDNGKQALDAFRAGEFDIVLTDLMMPEMSGDELIRHIRADGFTGQVVALTAGIIGKETDKLLEAGADAVLNKPLDIHDMKRTIAGLATKDSAS